MAAWLWGFIMRMKGSTFSQTAQKPHSCLILNFSIVFWGSMKKKKNFCNVNARCLRCNRLHVFHLHCLFLSLCPRLSLSCSLSVSLLITTPDKADKPLGKMNIKFRLAEEGELEKGEARGPTLKFVLEKGEVVLEEEEYRQQGDSCLTPGGDHVPCSYGQTAASPPSHSPNDPNTDPRSQDSQVPQPPPTDHRPWAPQH